MAGFLSGKMKRKDVDDVLDEFSKFSLSSAARKIRRLVSIHFFVFWVYNV